MSAGRFDYVRYDDEAQRVQTQLKGAFNNIDLMLSQLPDGRAKSLALTKLEEAYMWVGKAIRDEQVAKRGAELQEQRKDG